MSKNFIEDREITGPDLIVKELEQAEYDNCIFSGCDFSNANLSGFGFAGSSFKNCDLSNAKTGKTILRDVKFVESKLLGIQFYDCDDFLFSVQFENCILNFSSFYKRKLKKTVFRNCSLQEVDFTEADLTLALFENCDLTGARFENTVLENADLRTAFGFSIDPGSNRIKKAQFSLAGLPGLLDAHDIRIG